MSEQKPSSRRNKIETIERVLSESFDQWSATVPRGCSPDRLCRLFTSALKTKSALLECDLESIYSAFRDCVASGLDVGGELSPAYLAAYSGRLKFQIGYRGFLELAHRAGQVKTFRIESVHEGDLFQFTPSADDPILHTWGDDENRDERAVTHVYAQLVKTCGGVECEVWPVARIERHKEQYASNWESKSSKWNSEWLSMAKKTVILALLRSGRVWLSTDLHGNLES